jgi:hypothetical protein
MEKRLNLLLPLDACDAFEGVRHHKALQLNARRSQRSAILCSLEHMPVRHVAQ